MMGETGRWKQEEQNVRIEYEWKDDDGSMPFYVNGIGLKWDLFPVSLQRELT